MWFTLTHIVSTNKYRIFVGFGRIPTLGSRVITKNHIAKSTNCRDTNNCLVDTLCKNKESCHSVSPKANCCQNTRSEI